jgi:transcriptional regulator with XRE-family HTH domain
VRFAAKRKSQPGSEGALAPIVALMTFRNATTALTAEQQKEIGQMLRDRRREKDRGLKRLGAVTHRSPGHISRFERGERSLGWTAVEQLAAELDLDPAELIAVAKRIPPAIERALAGPGLAYALVGEGYRLPISTRLVLRRLSIAALVEKSYPPPVRREGLPDPAAALEAKGYRIEHTASSTSLAIELGRSVVKVAPLGDVVLRFELAHALGHVVLDAAGCDVSAFGSDAEIDATSFASYFLMPTRRLEAELGSSPPGLDMWKAGDLGALLEVVGAGLRVPAWLLARRLGDEGRLPALAGVAG